jgi:cytoskeletal protein RodZ
MPETRVEQGLFVLGLLAIAVLGFLVVHLWHRGQAAVAAPPTISVSAPPTTSASAPPSSTRVATTSEPSTTKTVTPTSSTNTTVGPAAGVVTVRFTAKSSTWLEVRSRSAAGAVLYAGTLTAGSSKVFHGSSLWTRFGAAGNVSAGLNGKAFQLPSGTYDGIFDSHGFRRLGG